MYIRKRMRTKIILVVILVLGFLFWRGSKAVTKERKLDCTYHLVYAVCKGNAKLPSFVEVLKAGVKF